MKKFFVFILIFMFIGCSSEEEIIPMEKVTDSGKNFSIEDFKKIGFKENKEYEVKEEMTRAILILNEIAKTLREERKRRGSINFNKKEINFKLDSDNNPIEVIFKENKEANKLIEELMLLANKKVAEIFKRLKKEPSVYRIHDVPDKEKLKALKTIVKEFGYSLDISSREGTSKTLNRLLKEVKGKKEQNLIELLPSLEKR